MSDLDAAVDELYRTAPEEFVAARNALAKELRGEKRRDEAKEVAGHRRPSRPAWALNQLALRGDPTLDALLDAVEAVREPPDGDVRAAIEGLRDAVTAAAEAAAKGAGLTAGKLAAALHATVSDGDALAAVTTGRLTDVPSAGASGFGVTLPATPPARPAKPEPEPDPELRRRAEAAVARAKAEVESAQVAVEEAQKRLTAAEAALENAEEEHARLA